MLALRARTLAPLRVLWQEWDPNDRASWGRFAAPATAIVYQNSREAADLGTEFYRSLRRAELGEAPRRPTLPVPVSPDAIMASLETTGLAGTYIGFRLGRGLPEAKSVAFRRVAGAAGRHVLNGARLAVAAAAAEDDRAIGYVRVLGGSGCDWCESLAGQRLASESFQSHDGCACMAEPVWAA